MKSYYKCELARAMGISRNTMTAYLRAIEDQLPHYHRTQTLLTPDQAQIVIDHYCIPLEDST